MSPRPFERIGARVRRRSRALAASRYWRTVLRLTLLGPLVGGLPFNVFLIGIPFSYLFGALPAAIGALGYAYWLHLPGMRAPGALHRAAFGALFGAFGCGVEAVVAASGDVNLLCQPLAFLLPFGVFAGAVLAALPAGARSAEEESSRRLPPLSQVWHGSALTP